MERAMMVKAMRYGRWSCRALKSLVDAVNMFEVFGARARRRVSGRVLIHR